MVGSLRLTVTDRGPPLPSVEMEELDEEERRTADEERKKEEGSLWESAFRWDEG